MIYVACLMHKDVATAAFVPDGRTLTVYSALICNAFNRALVGGVSGVLRGCIDGDCRPRVRKEHSGLSKSEADTAAFREC